MVLAIKPKTPVESIKELLPLLDMVLIMSVEPGFGGQKFIRNTFNKVKELKAMINEKGCDTLIEIDGGVDLHNASMLAECGADVLVAGSTVFKAENPTETIKELKL